MTNPLQNTLIQLREMRDDFSSISNNYEILDEALDNVKINQKIRDIIMEWEMGAVCCSEAITLIAQIIS